MNDRDEKYPSAEDEPPMKVKKGDKHTTTATSVCTPGAKEAAQVAMIMRMIMVLIITT